MRARVERSCRANGESLEYLSGEVHERGHLGPPRHTPCLQLLTQTKGSGDRSSLAPIPMAQTTPPDSTPRAIPRCRARFLLRIVRIAASHSRVYKRLAFPAVRQ